MAAASGFYVTGLKQLSRDLGKVSKDAQKNLRKELIAVAEPVAADVRSLAQAQGWPESTISGIRAGSRSGTAIVRQYRRKTTGLHPEFGGRQMRLAFLPGLDRNAERVERGAERMLDKLVVAFNQGGTGE